MSDDTSLSDALRSPSAVVRLRVERDEDASSLWPRLGELTSLEHLYLRSGLGDLPETLELPSSLRSMTIVVGETARESATLFEHFSQLEELEIWGRHLKEGSIPESIASMTELRRLELVSCGISDLPMAMARLDKLEELAIRGCPVKSFPLAITTIPGLRVLRLRAELSSLPDEMEKMQSLRELSLEGSLNKGLTGSDAKHVKPIPKVLGRLVDLESLNLGQCGVDDRLEALAPLTNLRSLDLSWGQTRDLSGLAPLKALEVLNLETCYKVMDISPLAALPALRSLNLSSNHYIESLEGLQELSALRELNIEGCSDIEELRPILEHPTLETLHADDELLDKFNKRKLLADMPDKETIIARLEGTSFEEAAQALTQLAAYLEINSTGERSAAFAYFGCENEDEELVDIPPLDKALESFGSELPSGLLIELTKGLMVSIIENVGAVLRIARLLVERGDAEAQCQFARQFHHACRYYDAGHRFWGETVLDELVDEVFLSFHPKAQLALVRDCGTDALSSDSGDAMDALFPLAFAKLHELDEREQDALYEAFLYYAREMIGYDHVDLVQRLRGEIKEQAPAAAERIDSELAAEELRIALTRRVEAIEDSGALVELLEELCAPDSSLDFSTLDDISRFSTVVVKYLDSVPVSLALDLLDKSLEVKARGWDWGRLIAHCAAKAKVELSDRAQRHANRGEEEKRHLLHMVDIAKQGYLPTIDIANFESDVALNALRELRTHLDGTERRAQLPAELASLLRRSANGHSDEHWKTMLATLRAIGEQEQEVKLERETFFYVQMRYESHVQHSVYEPENWSEVKDFLRAFVSSMKRLSWGQRAVETIAADGVASAQLSGDSEIEAIVFGSLMPDTVEKDRLAFNLACFYAVRGDEDKLLEWTEKALALGKAPDQFRSDDDFESFRDLPAFVRLLDAAE